MLTRRSFLVTSGAAITVRALPVAGRKLTERRVLTLIYDKALGAMRAIDRVVR